MKTRTESRMIWKLPEFSAGQLVSEDTCMMHLLCKVFHTISNTQGSASVTATKRILDELWKFDDNRNHGGPGGHNEAE